MSLPISIVNSKRIKHINTLVETTVMYKKVNMDDIIEYMVEELNEADELILLPNMITIQVPRFGEVYKYTKPCGRLGIIDLLFSEKFRTPYISINNVPDAFNGYLDDYKRIVHMLNEQLNKEFTKEKIFIGPHRKQLYKFLNNLS
jgi:hypothetical protein